MIAVRLWANESENNRITHQMLYAYAQPAQARQVKPVNLGQLGHLPNQESVYLAEEPMRVGEATGSVRTGSRSGFGRLATASKDGGEYA